MQQALDDLLAARTRSEKQTIVQENPELLSDAADTQLVKSLAIVSEHHEGEEAVGTLEWHRRLLARCRQVGIDKAITEFAEQEQKGDQSDQAARLNALRDELAHLKDVEHLPRRIECLEQGLALVSREQNAQHWAAFQVGLAVSLLEDPRSDRAENLERALGCYHASLKVYTQKAFPVEWAKSQASLGNAYLDRVHGEPTDNFERAIACYQAALKVFTPEHFPIYRAEAQHQLGCAYLERMQGERATNRERAIACFEAALRVRTRTAFPVEWARTQTALGGAYIERVLEDRADNLERAIVCFEAALEVATREALPEAWAGIQHNLGVAYTQRIRGDRADNFEHAIACYQAALEVFTREAFPTDWAAVEEALGNAYLQRVRGDRVDNLEEAIAYLECALEVTPREASPGDWASIQHNLGNAYRIRIRGERAANLERAIGCYNGALEIRTRTAFPIQWAKTRISLGIAYRERVQGDPAANVEQAIACVRSAEDVLSRRAFPVEWATVQHELANAYAQRIQGKRAENLEQAVGYYYNAALQVRTETALPFDWAATQNGLGNAHRERVRGERADNFERAIGCYENALQAFTRTATPVEWAITQANLGAAYIGRIHGHSADNLEQAITHLKAALKVRAGVLAPLERGKIQHNLGAAYQNRVREDRAANLECAIDHFEAALKVHTREALPLEWAKTQLNLGTAYIERVRGDRADNLERAIGCFEAALQVHTLERLPLDWAMTQSNLGAVCLERVQGDRADNLERAIVCYKRALEVFQPLSFPVYCRGSARGLGDAYTEAGRWVEAAEAYRTALEAAEILYASSLLREAKEAELAEISGLHVRAAYAVAHTEGVRAAREAVVILERGRARGLGEVLARDRADLTRVEPAAAAEDYQRAAEQLCSLEATEWRSAAAMTEPTFGQTSVNITEQARRAAQEALRREKEKARTELDRAIERIRELGFKRFLVPPDLDDIAAVVEPGSPLVYLAVTSAGSLTLLAHRPAGGSTVVVETVKAIGDEAPLTSGAVNELLVTQEDGEVSGGYLPGQLEGSQAWLEAALAELLPLLGQRLVGPLASRLRELGAHEVVLVACGRLGLLPLHAASYRRGEKECCLLDEFDVTYAPSSRVLDAARRACRAQEAQEDRVLKLVGVGNPLPTQSMPLVFAQAELEEVAACFEKSDTFFEKSDTFYGEDATKRALLEAATGATHVHLSCHGSFDSSEPLNSGLELAKGEQLSLHEILAQPLFAHARLVVASACQTAITDFTDLPDEAIGLPAGFLQAATPGVVGTLWSVHALSTALLMVRFYEYHLHGEPQTDEGPMSPARALRLAQRWLAQATIPELDDYVENHQVLAIALRPTEDTGTAVDTTDDIHPAHYDPIDRPFAAPYHWAPFVFVGA